MEVFDAVICKHLSVHVKKHCFLILHGMMLTTRSEMRHFYTLKCPAPFWLIQCKPYRNRFIIAKVIDKSLGARFLWPTVYIHNTYILCITSSYLLLQMLRLSCIYLNVRYSLMT